jgi:hypothetical protein
MDEGLSVFWQPLFHNLDDIQQWNPNLLGYAVGSRDEYFWEQKADAWRRVEEKNEARRAKSREYNRARKQRLSQSSEQLQQREG